MPDGSVAKTRKTALVAATRVEIEPTAKALGLRWRGDVAVGSYAGKPIHALLTGMGRSRAKAKVSNLLKQERFERLIHLGFAGALDPELAGGQLLHIRQILGEDGPLVDLKQGQTIHGGSTEQADHHDQPGHILLTADQMVHSAKAKAQFHDKYQAHAVDMESLHVARLCLEAQLNYLPLRVISDTADIALPPSAIRWVESDGTTNRGAVIGHIFRRPGDLGLIRTLGRNAQLGAQRLSQTVTQTLTAG